YNGSARSTYWSTHIGAFKFNACTPTPKGELEGTLTDAATGMPVTDAFVTIQPGGAVIRTDSDGQYHITLPVGDYMATASVFGYMDKGASVSVTEGGTTTQDFALNAAPSATFSGKVTDGSGHGYGLYA